MEIRLPVEPKLLSPLGAAELLAASASSCGATEWWIRLLKAISCNQLQLSCSGPGQRDGAAAPHDFHGDEELYLHIRDLGDWLEKQGYRVSYGTG
ncbi:MAG: hypothetical protein P8Y78_10560 [Acidihalobacter sp.]